MIPILLDYETLRVAWWVLLGVLLIGVAVMDGFDMGVAFLNPILGKNDTERRIIINTVGPVWEGNQVWLITGGGAIFAAWPAVYATAFSGFYLAMFLVLVSLILRPVSFEYRNKFSGKKRAIFDYTLFLSGIVPPLVFGVAFGNLFLGVPFTIDEFQLPTYHDGLFVGFLHLLKPFALLTGLTSVAMIVAHGAVYLAAKSEGVVQRRAEKTIYWAVCLWALLFAEGGFWVAKLDGYTITSALNHAGPSNPTTKTVIAESGVWLRNYHAHAELYAVPALAFFGALVTLLLAKKKRFATAFIASGTMIACTIVTAAVALFPFLLTSSKNPSNSLTVWDASSSHLTLWLMTIASAILVPLVILYSSWAFHILRGAISEAYIEKNKKNLY